MFLCQIWISSCLRWFSTTEAPDADDNIAIFFYKGTDIDGGNANDVEQVTDVVPTLKMGDYDG